MKARRPVKKGVFGRLLKMLFKFYPVLMPLTVFCIIFAAAAAAIPDVFIQRVVAVIEKWFVAGLPGDWASAVLEIAPLITILIVLYVLALAAITVYTQLMAKITQGFLSKLRLYMFDKMQDLPIKFFDTHQHGDIMSYYTNDIDAIRQLVSQAMPTLLRSGLIVIAVLGIMLYYSVWMTIVVLIAVASMFLVTRIVGGGSAKYFVKNQKALGRTEGFVQEMMNGQKVIKVFNHEQKAREDFKTVNDALFEDGYRANAYANIDQSFIMANTHNER